MNKTISLENSPKKIFIRRMFDDICESWFCRKKAIVSHEQDSVVLDICSGSGDMTIELLNRNNFNGMIILGDFSQEMHKLARQKLDGSKNVYYVNCDAENLPFKESTFDGIISGYSLRNLGDLRAFGSEIYRTLKTGGVSSLVDVAHPPNKIIARGFYLYFYKLIPIISRLFTKKKYAYRYLPVSLRTFLKQAEVIESLKGERLEGHYEELLLGAIAVYRLKK